MHDVAWRGMWICVRSKDAQKQLARTSLRNNQTKIDTLFKDQIRKMTPYAREEQKLKTAND